MQQLHQPKWELRKRPRVPRVPPQVPSRKRKSPVHSRGQALRRASGSGRAAGCPSRRAAIVFAEGQPGESGSEGEAAESDSGDIQLVTEAAPGGEPTGGGQLGTAHAGGGAGDGDVDAAAGRDAGDAGTAAAGDAAAGGDDGAAAAEAAGDAGDAGAGDAAGGDAGAGDTGDAAAGSGAAGGRVGARVAAGGSGAAGGHVGAPVAAG